MTFKKLVFRRWTYITLLGLLLTVAVYWVMYAAAYPLLAGSNPYATITRIESALWYVRIWSGLCLILGIVWANCYIHNADTEIWHLQDIELTKRMAVYQAELNRRNPEEKVSYSESLMPKTKGSAK